MSERPDAEVAQRRLHLWFFRDLSDDQRLGLFRLMGVDTSERPNHDTQRRLLLRLTRELANMPT